MHSLGKGTRGTKAQGQLQGQLEEQVTLPHQDQSSGLGRKETASQEPGVTDQMSTRGGREHSLLHLTFRAAF